MKNNFVLEKMEKYLEIDLLPRIGLSSMIVITFGIGVLIQKQLYSFLKASYFFKNRNLNVIFVDFRFFYKKLSDGLFL